MIHMMAALAVVFQIYKRCPRCGEAQRFEGKKKGDTVICRYCKHKFTLK